MENIYSHKNIKKVPSRIKHIFIFIFLAIFTAYGISQSLFIANVSRKVLMICQIFPLQIEKTV